MNKEALREQIIQQFRLFTQEKYQYDTLLERYGLPDFVTEDSVNEIRAYFLQYVYPDVDMRSSLDAAFESLDAHIKSPSGLIRVLMDATGILFKYGRHLPQIFRAGISALQSFRKASGFEGLLVSEALHQSHESIPDITSLKVLIAKLPYQEVRDFIESNDALFDALMDHSLMDKTIHIMHTLIDKMKKRPKIYSPVDIKGVMIGRDILQGGIELVKDLSIEQGHTLLELIKRVETDAIDDIFKNYST